MYIPCVAFIPYTGRILVLPTLPATDIPYPSDDSFVRCPTRYPVEQFVLRIAYHAQSYHSRHPSQVLTLDREQLPTSKLTKIGKFCRSLCSSLERLRHINIILLTLSRSIASLSSHLLALVRGLLWTFRCGWI